MVTLKTIRHIESSQLLLNYIYYSYDFYTKNVVILLFRIPYRINHMNIKTMDNIIKMMLVESLVIDTFAVRKSESFQ